MGTKYAKGTSVDPAKTAADIERQLERFGANSFQRATDRERGMAGVQFHIKGILYRMTIDLPDIGDPDVARTPKGRRRNKSSQEKHVQKERKRRWRALLLTIKSKLVAVDDGIAEFQQEFLPYMVLPDNRTVAEWIGPQIMEAVERGQMPQANVLGLPEPDDDVLEGEFSDD